VSVNVSVAVFTSSIAMVSPPIEGVRKVWTPRRAG
jgi:hypothetical protein